MRSATWSAPLAILATWLILGVDDPTHAQPAPPAVASAQPVGVAQQDSGVNGVNEDSVESAQTAPTREASVLMVTSVEVIRSPHPPAFDLIRVHGLTSTSGWTEPGLRPLTTGIPPDGILDLVFVAEAPPTGSAPMGLSPIAALFPVQHGSPYKGVRVRGADNAITLTEMPGYAEAQKGIDDCSACVGKLFLPTGSTIPAGKTTSDVVRQEDLPPVVRIVKANDGVSILDTNPNRLTVVLSPEGQIIDVAWD